MQADRDHYEAYYADKLWLLLPAVYRAEDTDRFDHNGPLREIVNRIGAQAAIVRRSMDRLWEDQSIETCDDWLIPYIADLLATRLVSNLDARGQRVDVAKTIYYRRRKGTIGLLEELAVDITGWDARVVEFFRRLGRTRHGLDPDFAPDANEESARRLQQAEGLIGARTQTRIGGWADLRNDDGATAAGSAFDEFFYSADVRRGRGRTGWTNISHFGVFLWRLNSFGVDWTTPVPVKGCPGQYVFDPTGREIALFAAAFRQAGTSYGANWVSPQEWQMPAPIRSALLAAVLAQARQETSAGQPVSMPFLAVTNALTGKSDLHSLGVFLKPGDDYIALDAHYVTRVEELAGDPAGMRGVVLVPERGMLRIVNPPAALPFVTYHYGFASRIGAGPYDHRVLGDPIGATPTVAQTVTGGGSNFDAKLAILAPADTRVIADSLTYTQARNVAVAQSLTLRADNFRRPVLRLPDPPPDPAGWTFTGTDGSELVLDGLLISGGDITLRGAFARVTLSCCTLDPGSVLGAGFAPAADGRLLIPCHLNVEGRVRELVLDRCIAGPIRARNGGEIETLTITDSIVQALHAENALEMATGEAVLTRCTLLGPANLDRLYASDCLLDDVVTVSDAQHGCVRFSAWATGSHLPGPYESVEIAPRAALFNSRVFGEAAYAQLREDADNAILSGATGATLTAGAEDGSEMGAFAREKNAIKARSLLIKYDEYMPLGLVPILIYAT